MGKIHIIKGVIDKIRISNSVFELLKPIRTEYGKTTALVDASTLLGSKYKTAEITVDDYKILD